MKNQSFKFANLIIDGANIKAVNIFQTAKIKVPKGYTGEEKTVFKVTIIFHQPIRPHFGYDLNLYEDDARNFLAEISPTVINPGSGVLPFSDRAYAEHIYEKDQTAQTSDDYENEPVDPLQSVMPKFLVVGIGRISGGGPDETIVEEDNEH